MLAGRVLTRESGLGDVEDGILVARSRELHHHLPGIDVLTRLGADRGDDTVEVSLELGVAKLVAGQIEISLGGSAPGLGGTQIAKCCVVGRLWRKAILQELRLARLVPLCFDHFGLSRGDLGFSRTQAVLKVLRVERRQRVTLSDACSDINAPNEHLPSDAE